MVMKREIFQIQIALLGFKPKIWRRLLVSSSILLRDLHKVIQTSMGWENAHSHQFIKDGKFYSPRLKDDTDWDEAKHVDYKRTRLHDLLKEVNDEMIYEYDFGDSWQHSIVLEKILPMDPGFKHPACITGKMRCPPEDTGGVVGYADLLEKLKDPKGESYETAAYWLGTEYDPEYFDKTEVNALLRSKNFGCY
jgi:hypothetical protein